ncbi:DUF4846 [Desulfonema magnum]|uniref:DUF4846 n=1 Tax=Desulfonema magnum TaxID=45655 RepID=A0A975BGH9_9BACT|nr:DUF4846 [Desulfonema magnum]
MAFLFAIITPVSAVLASETYLWLNKYDRASAIINQIPVPEGYQRTAVSPGSFESWLRHLPVKNGNHPVYLFNGQKKSDQEVHVAVIDIDVGNKDLQQCADAVIRLRAEYFYSMGNYKAIHFNFTSGDEASFGKWTEGYRPVVKGNKVRWHRSQAYNASYAKFRKYLDTVFLYAGTHSLSKELQPVKNVNNMKPGDVFIEGGFPGHAVIVVDMAVNKATGKKLFLLAQSYMPAQDIHILKNPVNQGRNPWYKINFGQKLYTPEWTFERNQLKRFP